METDSTVIETILFDVWRIEQPTVLLQITGGHKYFKLRGKMEVSLLDDLVKFVSKSSETRQSSDEQRLTKSCRRSETWLITNGMNVGIVQLIGQAIRKRKLTKPKDDVVALGICNYGCVKNLADIQRPEHVDTSYTSSNHRALKHVSGRSCPLLVVDEHRSS
jgi:hypothetical protein